MHEDMAVSEPLGIQHRWHSDSYNISRNVKFALPMYKHTPVLPFCRVLVCTYISYSYAHRNSGNGLATPKWHCR